MSHHDLAVSVPPVDWQLDRRRRAVARRSTLVAAGASAGGVLGHLVGGGALPTSGLTVLALLVVGAAAAAGAVRVARRSRGPGATWGVLLAGQVAMEGLLRTSAAHVSPLPPATALLHISTAGVLTALLLGGERVADDLRDVLDRWVPRAHVGAAIVASRAAQRFVAATPSPHGVAERLPRDPRGPPQG